MKEWKYFGIALLVIITPISCQQGYNYPTPTKPFNGGPNPTPVDYSSPTNGYPSPSNGSPHTTSPGRFSTAPSGDFSRQTTRGYPSSKITTSSAIYPTPTSSSYPDVTQNGYPSRSNGNRPGGYSSQGGSSYPISEPTGGHHNGYPARQNGFRDSKNGNEGSTTPIYSGNGYSSHNGHSGVTQAPSYLAPTYTSKSYPASQGGPSFPTYQEESYGPSQNQGQLPSPFTGSTEYPSTTVSRFQGERPINYQNGQGSYTGKKNGFSASQNGFPSGQNGNGGTAGETRRFIKEFESAPKSESSSVNEPDMTNEVEYSAIPGQPDADYPILSAAPKTSFRCDQQQYPGYYADLETRCQVFHICTNNKTYDFLCPNGTIFHQEFLVCVWWHEFDCNSAPSFYGVNADLYDYSFAGTQQQTGAIPAGDESSGGISTDLQLQSPKNGHEPSEPGNGQVSQGKYEPQDRSSQQEALQSTEAPRRYEGISQGYTGGQLQGQNGHQITEPPGRYDADIQGYPGRQHQISNEQYNSLQPTQLPGGYDGSQGYPEQRPIQSTNSAGQNGGYHEIPPQGSNGQQKPITQPPTHYQSHGTNGRHNVPQTTQTPERHNGVSQGYPSSRPYENHGQQRPIQSTQIDGQYPESQPGQQRFQSDQAPGQYKETFKNGRNGYLPPRSSQAPGDDRYSTDRSSQQQNGYPGNGNNGQYPASEITKGGTYSTTQGPRIPTQIPTREYLPPL